jgi:hypothetical protein
MFFFFRQRAPQLSTRLLDLHSDLKDFHQDASEAETHTTTAIQALSKELGQIQVARAKSGALLDAIQPTKE